MKLISIFGVLLFAVLLFAGCTSYANGAGDTSRLLGAWKLTEQYAWNESTGVWVPAIILENSSITSERNPPVYQIIKEGGTRCSSDGKYFEFVIAGGCAKLSENGTLAFSDTLNSNVSTILEWKVIGDKIEMVWSTIDFQCALINAYGCISKTKTLGVRVPIEEAESHQNS
ncbi:MAG: hypothetical protein V1644_01035 [Candidatus Micrarchaeota archaeon]